jgi:hypothetical protein
VIYKDLSIDLDYPRLQTDHEVVKLQADILEMFETMEEESAKRRTNGNGPSAGDAKPAADAASEPKAKAKAAAERAVAKSEKAS